MSACKQVESQACHKLNTCLYMGVSCDLKSFNFSPTEEPFLPSCPPWPALLPLIPPPCVSPSVFSGCSCRPPEPSLELWSKGVCRRESRSQSALVSEAQSREGCDLTSPGHSDTCNLGYIVCNEMRIFIASGIPPISIDPQLWCTTFGEKQ